MKMKWKLFAIPLFAFAVGTATAQEQTPIEELGDLIFDDTDLSINGNQSCAVCHEEEWGDTGPDPIINAAGAVYEGSIAGRFGDRKPPTAAYAPFSPIFNFEKQGNSGQWIGGNFWDGRATGEKLGNPAADQAQGPFLNPVEQALPDAACVVYRVSMAAYVGLYQQVWGGNIFSINFPPDTDMLCGQEGVTIPLSDENRGKVNTEFDNIALSIAAYEGSPGVSQFSSKFDLSRGGGKTKLSNEERRGFALFQGKGKCARCHVSNGQQPLFTDFTYDNLGVPSNPENPALLADPTFRDEGLGAFLRSRAEPPEVYAPELGKMKVPTLRNVDKRPTPDSIKAYTHNGYFKTLKGLVNFYNTRDVKETCPGVGQNTYTEEQALAEDCWPEPEVAENVNTEKLGNLGLTDEEEDAIVAFLKTLTDEFQP